ncbi:MAG: rRNA methyltransferase [Elusimicrobia bacterium]|nr:rRNA methyltransferase [Elusimicrobiota bacterium]
MHLCQPGYESFLIKELGSVEKSGPGWVSGPDAKGESCFAHLSLKNTVEVEGKSLNALAGAMADYFTTSTKDERFEGPWPFCVESAGDPGLNRRAKTAAEECFSRIKGRMSRVAKLAEQGRPGPGPARGFFAYLPTFDKAYVSREAVAGGQRRMGDDPNAPSRSYLKAEEAYGILGKSPRSGEAVVDLGAAPGGWSYSAAKRGASVVAVDNGPLKGGAVCAAIVHRAEDAFKFVPEKTVDWLFCDMVEDPDRIADLLGRWLENKWCRRFVVNLKFGRNDPLRVLARAEEFRPRCSLLRVRHLFHDREELTLVGELT